MFRYYIYILCNQLHVQHVQCVTSLINVRSSGRLKKVRIKIDGRFSPRYRYDFVCSQNDDEISRLFFHDRYWNLMNLLSRQNRRYYQLLKWRMSTDNYDKVCGFSYISLIKLFPSPKIETTSAVVVFHIYLKGFSYW